MNYTQNEHRFSGYACQDGWYTSPLYGEGGYEYRPFGQKALMMTRGMPVMVQGMPVMVQGVPILKGEGQRQVQQGQRQVQQGQRPAQQGQRQVQQGQRAAQERQPLIKKPQRPGGWAISRGMEEGEDKMGKTKGTKEDNRGRPMMEKEDGRKRETQTALGLKGPQGFWQSPGAQKEGEGLLQKEEGSPETEEILFYERPRFYVPSRYFDRAVFKEKQPYYITKSTSARGIFAILRANRGDALLFVTHGGFPLVIGLEQAKMEQVYIGKMVMEDPGV